MPEQKNYVQVDSIIQFLLNDKIMYRDIMFTVEKKCLHMENGIGMFTYWLRKEEGIRQDIIVNHKIQGASIEGVVLAVQADTVKLHLCIDHEQPEGEAFWYKCQTVYTADGSTGFYNMPQKGDYVELYFPKDNLENGYVKTAVRKDGENNLKTQNPDIKYWQNIHGKEIMIAPSQISITAADGIFLNMDEKQGIEITGSGTVAIHGTSASITGGQVAFRAGKQICFATTKSSITIDSEINIKASGNVSGI